MNILFDDAFMIVNMILLQNECNILIYIRSNPILIIHPKVYTVAYNIYLTTKINTT